MGLKEFLAMSQPAVLKAKAAEMNELAERIEDMTSRMRNQPIFWGWLVTSCLLRAVLSNVNAMVLRKVLWTLTRTSTPMTLTMGFLRTSQCSIYPSECLSRRLRTKNSTGT